MKKKIILLSITIVIILFADIYSVNRKQNELYRTIKEKETEIPLLRSQDDIDERFSTIKLYNAAIKDYNVCVKIFPNNLYNKVLLGRNPMKYYSSK